MSESEQSLSIAARAVRGGNALVAEAEIMLEKAASEKGPATPVSFPNTAYYLPTILGVTGRAIEKIKDLQSLLEQARVMLQPGRAGDTGVPHLAETLDAGMATLLAAETIEAIRFAYGLEPESMPGFHLAGKTASPDSSTRAGSRANHGHLNGPIDDVHVRAWGVRLVDSRMPGFAVVVGCAKTNAVAVKIVRELQRRNIPCFLSGNVKGRSIIHQLSEEGVELGYDTGTIPLGTDTISVVYALGFAARAALTFGRLKPGMSHELLLYNRDRIPAFVLVLGDIDDLKCATLAGALNFGLPAIADTVTPQILPTGTTTNAPVLYMPFSTIDVEDDLEKAERLVGKCLELRGIRAKAPDVDLPVPYGSVFEREVVQDEDLRVEFGGKDSRAFEFLQATQLDHVTDGKIEVIGPDFSKVAPRGSTDLGIVVKVAGRQMQANFEPILERQIHDFTNGASGIHHTGRRDGVSIRISNAASNQGFTLESFGEILQARFHEDFGSILDKLQITIITEPKLHAEWLQKARLAYDLRDKRVADLTDDQVDEFYSCSLCRSCAPNHVCLVSPERPGLCGACDWLECKAAFSINPAGAHQPVKLGRLIDGRKGLWEGASAHVKSASFGAVDEVSMYSIMDNPMTSCGCAECIVMLIPEANGVMVVSREDTRMTPAGMSFSMLAGIVGGGLQTPGLMGIAKGHLTSPKFIQADGGFKRVVWMSSVLKETLSGPFKAVCQREGDRHLLDKIADERNVSTVKELLVWLEAHNHPAQAMPLMF